MKTLSKEQYCYADLVDRLIMYYGDDDFVNWIESQYIEYLKEVKK